MSVNIETHRPAPVSNTYDLEITGLTLLEMGHLSAILGARCSSTGDTPTLSQIFCKVIRIYERDSNDEMGYKLVSGEADGFSSDLSYTVRKA